MVGESKRGCARAGPADRRSASSPVGPSGQPLHAGRDFARHQHGAPRARNGVRRMHVDVSCGRSRIDAAGGRDRVRQRHRGAKRERTVRRHASRGENRQLRGLDAGRRGHAGARGAYRAAPARFRGIRHAGGFDASSEVRNSHTNPPPELYDSTKFREGFAKLSELGLSFEAWQYHPQMPMVTALAKAFPDTTIVLNHFGGPLGIGPYEGKRAEIFGEWKKNIAELARCPNVVVKLGGINMPVNGFGWHRKPSPPASDELASATRDYYLHAIEKFGPRRCMFESNFPVDRASCSYAVLWNAFKKIAAGFTKDEKAQLFHRTAAEVYRLKLTNFA